jgi:hypothetical protein
MITVKTKNNPFTRMGDLLGSPRVASLEKSALEKKKILSCFKNENPDYPVQVADALSTQVHGSK